MLRRHGKAFVEATLVRGGVAALARRVSTGAGIVLAYHNIVPEGAEPVGDRSLHLPVEEFRAQLDDLLDTHEVVPLDMVLWPDGRRARRPRIAITFDDAYRGAVTCGVAELHARGLPATIFVSPAFVGGGSFWWDEVAAGAASGELDEAFRGHALTELCGIDSDIRGWAAEKGIELKPVPEHARVATVEELGRALQHPGLTLGSHSWSHPNLTRLASPALRAELERPLQWLQEHFERVRPWLSYPYGLSSPTVEAAAKGAGYSAGLLVCGGPVPRRNGSPYGVPRVNIPAGLSRNGFALRAAGLYE